MSTKSSSRLRLHMLRPVHFVAVLSVALGASVLGGWVFNVPFLKSVLPGAVEMKANTAMAMALAGCALFVFGNRPSPACRGVAQAIALTVAALGVATLAAFIVGILIGDLLDLFLY